MSGRQQERFTVKLEKVVRETDAAVLVMVDADEYGLVRGEDQEKWFPLSQVHEIVREAADGPYIVVTPWIAERKGLR